MYASVRGVVCGATEAVHWIKSNRAAAAGRSAETLSTVESTADQLKKQVSAEKPHCAVRIACGEKAELTASWPESAKVIKFASIAHYARAILQIWYSHLPSPQRPQKRTSTRSAAALLGLRMSAVAVAKPACDDA